MKINAALACGGTLLATTSLLIDVGVAWEFSQLNATTSVGLELPLHQDFGHSLDDERGTTATATADRDGDGDNGESRALQFGEAVTQAITKVKNGLQTLAKFLRLKSLSDSDLHKKTRKLFSPDSLNNQEPEFIFREWNFQEKIKKTMKLYKQDEEKAYASIYLCLVEGLDKRYFPYLFDGPLTDTTRHLMVAQLNYWEKLGLGAAETYKRLKLDLTDGQVLKDWRLPFWLDYVKQVDKYSNPKLRNLVNQQGNRLNNDELVELLRAQSTDPILKIIGPQLEKMLH